MPRSRARRVDADQQAIVDAFRQAGARVRDCSGVGDGHPDLIVVWDGWPAPTTRYVEVKGPRGRLTAAQRRWAEETGITPYIVRSPREALELLGIEATIIDPPARRVAQAARERRQIRDGGWSRTSAGVD